MMTMGRYIAYASCVPGGVKSTALEINGRCVEIELRGLAATRAATRGVASIVATIRATALATGSNMSIIDGTHA